MAPFFPNLTERLRNPELMALIVVMTVGTLVIHNLGAAIAPFITAIVVAYLLEGMVRSLVRLRIPRLPAVLLVFSLFVILLILLFGVLVPILAQQLTRLLKEIPRIAETLRGLFHQLTDSVSGMINPGLVNQMMEQMSEGAQDLAAFSVTYLLQLGPGLLSLVIYLFLVPFLVFFFMKDKEQLIGRFKRFLPRERDLLYRVLRDADRGLGGYVRGKFWEMLLLGVLTYLVFAFMGVQYAFLLGLLTGLSVYVPFLGIVVVTVPVVFLILFQFGMTWEAAKPLLAWSILQVLDANLFIPLILGETVRVHPTTIILAVLLFGYLWGLLGVFFAVPLAVLVKSIFDAIPMPGDLESETDSA